MAFGSLSSNIPGVYTSVEARDFKLGQAAFGRKCLVVILSDRGRHNQVVRLTNHNDFYREYGYPDLEKYGYGHYLVDIALQYSNEVYVIRPALTNPEILRDLTVDYEDCMAISHAYIYENDVDEDAVLINDIPETSISAGSNIIDLSDTTSLISDYSEGMWIFPEGEHANARQIVQVDNENYQLVLDSTYDGIIPIGPSGVSIYSMDYFQVITKKKFPGSDEGARLRNLKHIDTATNDDIYFVFAARGTGAKYNSYYLRGSRNTRYEYMFTDADGNPLYPYAFVDIALYRYNEEDNSSIFVEGPWTVSLIARTESGTPIRDIFTGREMFIETVINDNSDFIKCITGKGANKLVSYENTSTSTEEAKNRRLHIQSLFAYESVQGSNVLASPNDQRLRGGFFLTDGEDGILFNDDGTLNYGGEYQALVTQAYMGKLTSVDGSIELLDQVLYPKYKLNYVFCGGYYAPERDGARLLVDTRGDTMLLSDVSHNALKSETEIENRKTSGWNTWNAMCYSQWRQMFDEHTGKYISMTPVYDEIEHHLSIDNNYFLSEPVAGIEKGAIQRSIELTYKPTLTELSDLIAAEINPTISEPDGTYTLTQYTTFKRLSSLKRGNWAKFVHFIMQEIPRVTKDILQRKASAHWISQAERRVNGLLNPYVDTGEASKFASLENFETNLIFDDLRDELNVIVSFNFLGIIEKITANIIVV